jgi:hypothetical protein
LQISAEHTGSGSALVLPDEINVMFLYIFKLERCTVASLGLA